MNIFAKKAFIGAISVLLVFLTGQTGASAVEASRMKISQPDKIMSLQTEMNVFPKTQMTNLILRETDVQSVLRILAKEGKKNIVLDDSVKGVINADLKNITLNQAFQSILTSQELEARVDGSTIFVGSRPAMARKGLNRKYIKAFKLDNSNAVNVAKLLEASIFNTGYKIDQTQQQQQTSSQPSTVPAVQTTQPGQAPAAASTIPATITGSTTGQSTVTDSKTIRGRVEEISAGMGFGDAGALASQIKIQSVASADQDIAVSNNDGGAIVIPDTRTNSILVCGLKEDIQLAAEAIKYLDKKLPQVRIEVSLVELKNNKNNTYKLTLGGQSGKYSSGFNTDTANPNLNQIGANTLSKLSDQINAKIQYSLETGNAKLLANPTVMALDGSESLIKITDQIVSRMTVTTSTQGVITYSPELADIGIVLNILPKISTDGSITMRVRPSITTPLEKVTIGDGFATLISTREVILQDARVKSGETLEIAGLIKDQDIQKFYKIPVASDLPIFGQLFTNRSIDKTKSDLIILIKPTIIDDVETN